MSFPPNPPNWNSSAPQSGWYLYAGDGENIVWAMTGREFVRRAQAQLVSYFTSAPQAAIIAYRRGGPANAANTGFTVARIQAPGPGGAPDWGSVSNAALWAWGRDHSLPQRWLDAIENQIRDRRWTNEGLFTALWLMNHYAVPYAEAARRIQLASPEMLPRIVLPPFLAAPPADGLEAGQIYHWNPATENPPRARSQTGAPAPTPTPTPTTPGRPGTPATTTPGTVPTSPGAPTGMFLGLTGLQWGLGVAALAGVGGLAWYLNVRDERPAAHGVKFPRGYPALTAHRRI